MVEQQIMEAPVEAADRKQFIMQRINAIDDDSTLQWLVQLFAYLPRPEAPKPKPPKPRAATRASKPKAFKNPSPSGDPFFADPRNVAEAMDIVREGEKAFAEGRYKTLVTDEDIDNFLGF